MYVSYMKVKRQLRFPAITELWMLEIQEDLNRHNYGLLKR
jgi:hypothetical protein